MHLRGRITCAVTPDDGLSWLDGSRPGLRGVELFASAPFEVVVHGRGCSGAVVSVEDAYGNAVHVYAVVRRWRTGRRAADDRAVQIVDGRDAEVERPRMLDHRTSASTYLGAVKVSVAE